MSVALDELPVLALPPAVLEDAAVAAWVLDDLVEEDLAELSDEQLRHAVSAWHGVASG
jgi:hypothetical protein